jgi:hypothetical protein
MLGIIDKHYRDLGKPPSGEKHGTYTPSEALGTAGRGAGQTGRATLVHNTIMDKPAYDANVAALSNGKPGTRRRHSQRNH